MYYFILAALAVALLITVLALIPENRLRRALQKLLRAILQHRRHDETNHDL